MDALVNGRWISLDLDGLIRVLTLAPVVLCSLWIARGFLPFLVQSLPFCFLHYLLYLSAAF